MVLLKDPMKKRRLFFSLFLISLLSMTEYSYGQGGLFASTEPMAIELKLSLKQLRSETNGTTFMRSQMIFQTPDRKQDTVDIEIRTRGNFRLGNCYYPPIRIKMKKKAAANTVFEEERNLKLVLPCSRSKTAGDYLGKEYLAYQLYEEVSEYFFHTRLLHVRWIDTDGKKEEVVELLGFFIEDDDDVAQRFGGKILSDKKIVPTLMEDSATVRHDFFQLMIGNTDWSGIFQHNSKVMMLDDRTIVPLAYDFDMTGLVNPPYAQVNVNVGIENVTDRLYRGFCRDPELMQAIRAEVLSKEARVFEIVSSYKQYFSLPHEKACRQYLKEFFDILRSDRLFEDKVLKACRSNMESQRF
jgi:hypothetical protein